MNSQMHSDITVGYYDANAATFSRDADGINMNHLYGEFIPLLPKGGKVLDAGCGSGRDSVYFQGQGFTVTAFDASKELASIASKRLGQRVRVMGFLDVEFSNQFDGVWACASLLHLSTESIEEGMRRLARSLKTGGIFYASFKYGSFEGQRGGRFFCDYTEGGLSRLLTKLPMLKALKTWRTADERPEHADEQWLNAILSRI